MPFIGNQPALSYTSFAKQDFTTSATTSYTLNNPVANENEIALFINFVRQEPTTAYTASGTTLTLTSATSASDDMYCVFLGKAVQTVNPPAGSVDSSKINYPLTTFSSTGIDDNATSTAITIDSSGNLLVGKTATGISNEGISVLGGANAGTLEVRRNIATANSSSVGYISRGTSDGNILTFYKDTTTVGSIGVQSGDRLYVASGSGLDGIGIDGHLFPTTNTGTLNDNDMDLGLSNARWDDVFATNGTIQTSDQNEKQSIQSLTTAEMNVAKRLSPLIKTFKWNSSVEEKGDSARTHTGIIAQDVQQAFTDEGLDASNYALFISNTWWENSEGDTKEEATDGYTERTRLGVRYPELLSFIQAYNDQRFTELEARITQLENN